MAFIVQKLHPGLQLGQRVTIAGSKMPVHSGQGSWDGGCALHCLAMVGALNGILSDTIGLSFRRRGPEAEFWDRTWPHYLSGVTLGELAGLLYELQWDLRPVLVEGKPGTVLRFCERELLAGHLVIVSWTPSRAKHYHAVLAIGLEGMQRGHTFTPQTLLLLDPSENEPWLATCNARLTYAGPTMKNRKAARYVTGSYESAAIVDGALSIRQMRRGK